MATQGPNFPGTAASLSNAGTSESSDAWVNPGNIVSDNGTESTITAASYDSPDISQLLVASNFGFTIPVGSTINGITVEVDRRSIIANSGKDFRVQLATGTTFATLVGSNKAVPATIWPTTATIATYGGAADTWSSGLTVAQINDPGLAVMLSCQANIANADIGVDFVRVTITYTAPAPEEHSGSFGAAGGGSFTSTRSKGALSGVTATGGGVLTWTAEAAAVENHDGSFAATGGGAVATAATTNRSGELDATGAGVAATAATSDRSGAIAATGAGTAALSASTERSGAIGATGAGAFTSSVEAARYGAFLMSGGGALTLAGTSGREGDFAATGGGSAVITGTTGEDHSASFTATGGGAATFATLVGKLSGVTATGSGDVAFAAMSERLAAFAATGGGRATFLSAEPPAPFVVRPDAVVGISFTTDHVEIEEIP